MWTVYRETHVWHTAEEQALSQDIMSDETILHHSPHEYITSSREEVASDDTQHNNTHMHLTVRKYWRGQQKSCVMFKSS